jgi:hypothetical protein
MSVKRAFAGARSRTFAWLLGSPLLIVLLAACGNNNGGGPGY